MLAGGRSRRFGRDKAFERLNGDTLIGRVLAILEPISTEIVVVCSLDRPLAEPLPLAVRIVADEFPDAGPLGGLYSGLRQAASPYALLVGCDMPFLNRDLIGYQASLVAGHDVVVPRLDGNFETLHAVYSKDCLPAIRPCLEAGQRRVIAFFDAVRVRVVEQAEIDRFDPDHRSFFNVNTEADMALARGLARREPALRGAHRD